ncbi:glycosyltransferase [Calidifontibacter indicus]|uniref:glycosyltransferase n=1 Tax=Calidifontibacter indicus TaxID=419650 RepID=UPI003D74D25F
MSQTPAPLLSIVVPFYNVGAYIGACLESLRTQLLDDIEVIMVDDGGSDDSVDVAREYAAKDPRFTLVSQENQGLGPARNTGTAHARGKYLTFVDSDDLVAPRAYTLMVGSLEETGSAFAAGNAYRFSSHKGAYQSWTHRQPFAKTRIATTIDDVPVLMRDRMIWNKVYRRSFWDAGGYEFPPIRYEDYMVTLRAYLEAPAVDIFADHVYFWRDRESGDSITQQAARADNARDRFLSAAMVLDVLASHKASDEVRERVHAYFIHIDLVALAESMVCVPEADRPAAEKMALDLARKLDPSAGFETTRLAHLVHRSLLDGDLEMVRHLANWRLTGDTKTFARKLARHPRPQVVPTALGAVVSRRKPQNPLRPRRLKNKLVNARWDDDERTLVLVVDTTLRRQLAERARPSAELEWGDKLRAAVEASAEPNAGGLRLTVTLDERHLRDFGDEWLMANLWIELRVGTLAWRGQVRIEPEALPGIRQMSDGSWIQPRGIGWYFGLRRLVFPTVIDRVELDGDRVRLYPRTGQLEKPLIVRRPAPSPMLEIPLREGAPEVGLAELVADDPPDNIVTGVAERPFVQVLPSGLPPLWRFTEREPDAEPLAEWLDEYDEYVYLAGNPVQGIVGDTKVTVGRGWYGMLVVRQEPAVHETPVSDSSDMPAAEAGSDPDADESAADLGSDLTEGVVPAARPRSAQG